MRVLYLDCFSGISGDMMVGALHDLGVEADVFERALAQLPVGGLHIQFARQSRCGINGAQFLAHARGEEHHHSRTHAEIREMISKSGLSDFVKKRALNIFERIAIAEGKIHGISPEQVAFHEVGALDSIADIICACAGLEALETPRVYVSFLRDGRGWIECAHGRLPIPAPATLEILAGIRVEQIDEPFEFITPTGAAIVAEFAESFGLMPPLKIDRIGYGVGERELKSRPNVLRAVLGELVSAGGYQSDSITLIETNIDDISPEIIGGAMDKLFAAGALDVFTTNIQMKKNRPGMLLSVLCEHGNTDSLAGIIFSETSTFGVRIHQCSRLKLERRLEQVQTPFGDVSVKVGLRDGRVIRVSPEFESCRELSERSGQPLQVIYQAAVRAYESE